MAEPHNEHGVENEPHLRSSNYENDPSEALADRVLDRDRLRESDADQVEHNVWEEPALSADLVDGPGEDQLTYSRWLESRIQNTTVLESMGVTLLVILAAGPWGVLGAFWTALYGTGWQGIGLLAVVVVGPVTEEVVKISVAWWVVEKRPYLFKSIAQILFCAGCGGLAFAAIENLVYMYVYVPDHSLQFVLFRWTVCVGLHVSCSLVAGLGLARVWDNAIRNRHRPKTALGIPWLVVAITGHGLYNLSVTIASLAGWLDFLK
jgi:hypothetical protein